MIVMDLEWNHGTVDKQLLLEGRTLRFEIIQIGAVQVDNLGNICKTFERLVMPCVHRTIMPKVIELTGITDRSLKGQQGFVPGLLPLGGGRRGDCILGKLRQGSFAVQSAVPQNRRRRKLADVRLAGDV